MEVHLISVFVVDDPLVGGNPLAVLLPRDDLSTARMQAIARTLGLSESAFVREVSEDSYDVRIFTPEQELDFAGHPTLGTAWVLRRAGLLRAEEIQQRSRAGVTRVRFEDDRVWFERRGAVEDDLEERATDAPRRIGAALGLTPDRIGLEAREMGRPGHLRPAVADAGLRQLMAPVRDLAALQEARPNGEELRAMGDTGAYVFTATGAGTIRARGFWSPVGVPEDPATGSAAAGLGIYLASRLGDIRFEITQGVEMGRPSRIDVVAKGNTVHVGGSCGPILSGEMDLAAGS